MKKSLFLLFNIAFCISVFSLQAQNGYKNPILPGFYPDPSICRVGDDYYEVNSSFGYFPGVPIFHSKDLVNWEQIGYILTTGEQLPISEPGAFSGVSGGIFAPCIRYNNGVFYMVTTNMNRLKNFMVTAKNPEGPWSAPIYLNLPGMSIDPSLFFDDDGKAYLITSPDFADPAGIRMAQIDVGTGALITPMKSLWSGTGGWSPEGPRLYKKDGWYYLMIAEGGTEYGHKVVIARSKNIDGPYTSNPANPILTHTGRVTQNSPIQGVGHGDMVQAANGTWWMVALGFRPQSAHHILGRETFLAPVEWPKDEWPVVNKNGTIALDMMVPTLSQHPYKEQPGKDDFTKAVLGFEWNYLSNPVTGNYSLSERPGYLRLKGVSSTLAEGKQVAFAGRRQQHEEFSAATSLDFKPANETDEAGLTVFMDYKSHYDLSVKNIGGKRMLLLTYYAGMIKHVEKEVSLNDGPVELKVEGSVITQGYFSADYYSFSFAQGTKAYEPIAKAEGFTGVYIGMFATGNGKNATANADFDWFDYQHQ